MKCHEIIKSIVCVLLIVICVLWGCGRSEASLLTYNYSGRIIKTLGLDTIEGLVGQNFSGSITYDTEDIYFPLSGFLGTQFYYADNSKFFIDGGNYIDFTKFNSHSLLIKNTTLSVVADTSATKAHEFDWHFDSINRDEAYLTYSVNLFGASSPEYIHEGLHDGSLNSNDFLDVGAKVWIDDELYSLSKYLSITIYQPREGFSGLFFDTYRIYGEVTGLESTPNAVPEPMTMVLLGGGLLGAVVRRRKA